MDKKKKTLLSTPIARDDTLSGIDELALDADNEPSQADVAVPSTSGASIKRLGVRQPSSDSISSSGSMSVDNTTSDSSSIKIKLSSESSPGDFPKREEIDGLIQAITTDDTTSDENGGEKNKAKRDNIKKEENKTSEERSNTADYLDADCGSICKPLICLESLNDSSSSMEKAQKEDTTQSTTLEETSKKNDYIAEDKEKFEVATVEDGSSASALSGFLYPGSNYGTICQSLITTKSDDSKSLTSGYQHFLTALSNSTKIIEKKDVVRRRSYESGSSMSTSNYLMSRPSMSSCVEPLIPSISGTKERETVKKEKGKHIIGKDLKKGKARDAADKEVTKEETILDCDSQKSPEHKRAKMTESKSFEESLKDTSSSVYESADEKSFKLECLESELVTEKTDTQHTIYEQPLLDDEASGLSVESVSQEVKNGDSLDCMADDEASY